MGKGPLSSVAIRNKGKVAIIAIQYSALDRAILFRFTTTPNHFGYGLIGQVSALESWTYTWTLEGG